MLTFVGVFFSLQKRFNSSPFLPALGAVLDRSSVLQGLCAESHRTFGDEISYFWTAPFWRLAARLKEQLDLGLVGLDELADCGVCPSAIIVVDLPLRLRDLTSLKFSYPNVPLILVQAESPLERHNVFSRYNLSFFDAVIGYSVKLARLHPKFYLCKLPFHFYRDSHWLKLVSEEPFSSFSARPWRSAFIGSAASSGWKRNFQYSLGIKGLPVLWQYLQGWKNPLESFVCDEVYSGYYLRRSAVVASRRILGNGFFLSGSGWDSGGTDWFKKLLPDRRLTISSRLVGMNLGSKHRLLASSKISLVVENYLGDSGYISEKIYDSLAAGAIPLYFGPNRASIPPELKASVLFPSERFSAFSFLRTRGLLENLQTLYSIPDQRLFEMRLSALPALERFVGHESLMEGFMEAMVSAISITRNRF
jgi:hypothetical protein